MLEDDSKVIAYDWNYTTANGTTFTTVCVYDYERKGVNLEAKLKELHDSKSSTNYRIMTFAEFMRVDREMTLSEGVYEVSRATFLEMLETLPPLKWGDRTNKDGVKVNEFCMSEFDHGPYTHQYASAYIDGETRYYGATVDYFDESTWIHNRI